MQVDREVMTHEQFELKNNGASEVLKGRQRIAKTWRNLNCDGKAVKRYFMSFFPVYKAVRTYKLKEWIAIDIVAGLTYVFPLLNLTLVAFQLLIMFPFEKQ